MPAKDSIGKYHGRYPFLGRTLWRKYKRETGDKLSYAEFAEIIDSSMKEVRNWVVKEPIGFQLSRNIGNLTINKFKPRPDYVVNHKTPTGLIRNFNLHTGGYMFKVQWFHAKTSHKSRSPYWFFKAGRTLNRTLAAVLKSGKSPNFNSFMQNHFVNNN